MSPRCTHPFLPWGRRPHVTLNTFGTRDDPCNATSTGSRISGLQSFADVQSPPLARPPGRTHRSARRHWAARPFTPRIARRVTPTGMWHRYVTDLGNCHGWTHTSWIPILSAAPSRIRLSDKEAHASIARSLRVGRRLQILNVRGEVNRLSPLSLSFSSATGLLELGSLPSTGVTRLPRYYEPVRHPRRPGLSLAGVRLGFRSPPMGLPVLQQLPVCRHAVTITPVGPLDRIVRSEGLSTPRYSPATAAFPDILAGRLPR